MDFSEALDDIKNGDSVRRTGWHGMGMRVALVVPEDGNEMPYLRLYLADGSYVPWTVSQTDVLANDWKLVDD